MVVSIVVMPMFSSINIVPPKDRLNVIEFNPGTVSLLDICASAWGSIPSVLVPMVTSKDGSGMTVNMFF